MADKQGKQEMSEVFSTRIDLKEDVRDCVIGLLNMHLADTFDLYSQTKQAHWNVKGSQFYQLHELYDELAETLLSHVDLLAERATALGGVAMGTARMAASHSRLPEFPSGGVMDMQSVQELSQRYATLAASARKAIKESEEAGDMVTSDLFIGLVRDLDKSLWFLEAHLQQAGRAGMRKAA